MKQSGKPVAAVILAAGLGKRMQSDLPKVFHPVGGRPMLSHVLDTVMTSGISEIYVVVGHRGELIKDYFKDLPITFVEQKEQRGTAHAVMQTESYFAGRSGTILVLNGDVPCIQQNTLRALRAFHSEAGLAATVLTMEVPDPTGYGRISRLPTGEVEKIVEEKDATPAEKQIKEVNTGTFCFESPNLFSAIQSVHTDNAQEEYYLTDVIGILRRGGDKVGAHQTPDWREVRGVNTPFELAQVEKFFQDVAAVNR